jgi:hypothetical protein
MLLDDLLEARVVQLRELGQVVHVGDDVAQVLLQQLEVVLGRAVSSIFCPGDDIVDLLLRRSNAADDLVALDLSEGVDLVQLRLELLDKLLLLFFVPGAVGAQCFFETFVVDVVVHPVLDEGRLELLSESAGCGLAWAASGYGAWMGGALAGGLIIPHAGRIRAVAARKDRRMEWIKNGSHGRDLRDCQGE